MGEAGPRGISVLFRLARLSLMMLCVPAAWPKAACADDSRVDELARQLRDVQSQLNALNVSRRDGAELKGVQDAAVAQVDQLHKRMDAQTHVSMTNGRFSAASSEGSFSFALRATVQFDVGHFSQSKNPANVDLNSGTNFRRAQFGFVGTAWRDWAYNFTYDFGGNGIENRGYLYRAYIEYDGLAPVGFRVGAFSAYDSVEDATGGANLALMERPTAVTIARSIGAGSGREGAEVFAQGERYLVSLALTGGRTTDAATFDEQHALVGRVAWLAMDRRNMKWLLNVDATHVLKLADVAAGPTPSGVISLSAGPELSIDASRTVDTGALDAWHVSEFGMETALNLGRLLG